MSKVNLMLLQHCTTEEARDEFLHHLYKSDIALKRVVALMRRFANEARPGVSDYSQPSWDYRMADWIGYDRAVKKLEELLSHLDQKETSDHE